MNDLTGNLGGENELANGGQSMKLSGLSRPHLLFRDYEPDFAVQGDVENRIVRIHSHPGTPQEQVVDPRWSLQELLRL